MDPLLKLACLLDAQGILKCVNIVLTVLLILVLGVLVLVFLRGLLRGWKYGTYRLIFFAIMVTVVLATLGAQANALGGMGLTRLNLPNLNFTLTIDEVDHAISVKWTTLQASLEDLIIQIAEAFGAKGSYTGMISYASVLATSFIKLLLIFVWGVLLSTFGMLLIMLLWHLIFKRFTPLDRRKIKKLRLVSAFEELLIGAACLGMLLSPFTSIVNSMNSNFRVEDEHAKENETVSMITDILGVYDQSAFAKTFFSWNSMDGSTTFDQQLISFLTQSEVKEVKTDLVSEVSALAGVSAKAINAGLLSAQGSEGIKWYLLLSSSSIPELIYALSETKLIQCALPFAVSLAVNLDAIKDVLGEETCKYLSDAEVDWEEAVQSMSRIYQNILDAGIIDCVVDVENGSPTPQFDWTQLQHVFSGKDASGNERDAKAAMHSLASEFEDSALFSHLMAGLLSQLGKEELEKETRADLSILDFLPLTEDGKSIDYQALVNLNYTKEFNLLYDTIYSINDVSPEVVSEVLGLVQNPPTEEDSQDKYRSLLSKSAKYAESYVELVVGERDEAGEPKDDSKDCLFDSVFVGNALPSLLPYIEKAGSSALDMDLKLTSTKEELKDWKLKDYKREFGATLDVAAKFASSEAGASFLEDGTGMAYKDKKLISIDPELVKALQNSLELSDKSKIMTEALPQVAEKYFEDFRTTLSEFGIENVDFGCENFGSELSCLLNLLSYSGDLILALNNIEGASAHLMATMLLEEKDSLVRILDIFAGSKILNPIDPDSGKTNMNMASLLNYVFSSAGLDDFKLEADALDGVVLVSERANGDIGEEVTSPHENALIVEAITSVPLSELMTLGGASGNEMMKALAKIDVETLFSNIGKSEVMRLVSGSAMDKYFTSVLEAHESEGISFKNLTTAEEWESEGKTIRKIANLATKGIDISEFDINGVSPSLMEDLFSNLARSSIFNKKLEDGSLDYRFPEFFSSKVLKMLDENSLPYFADKGVTDLDVSDDLTERKAKCSTFVSNCLALKTVEDWTSEEGGEIELFSKIMGGVQSLGGFSSLSSFSKGKLLLLRDLLNSLASSEVFGSVLIANALTKSLDNLSADMGSSSFDLSLANPEIFFSLDKTERVDQAGCLCDVLDTLYDPYYGLLDDSGKFEESKISIDTLNVDCCLRPLLEDISSSKVFSTQREGKDETLLKSFFKTLLVKSNLYGEGLEKTDEISHEHAPGISISSLVDGIKDMDAEISSFCDTVKIAQESGLLSGGSLSLSSLDSSKLDSVSALLEAINSSDLLYRALPIQIDKAIKGLEDLPASFKDDLLLCDPFAMRNDEGEDYARYEDSEIACLSSLLTGVGDYSDLGSASISDLAKLDLGKTLSPLYASRVFNGQVSGSGEKAGLTSAQAFVTDILAQMGLDDLIYSSSSPKDSKNGVSSPEAKYKYLISSTLGIGDAGNYKKYSLESQKSNEFYEVLGEGEGGLSTFLANLSEHSLLSCLEGGSIDFASLTKSSSTLSALLKDLSHCALLRDVPMNALAKYLSGTGGDGIDFSVDGVELSQTNFYYPYSYDSSGKKLDDSDVSRWACGYDDDEIDLLVDLLDLVEANKSSLGSGDVGKFDAYSLRQMLLEFKDSLLFHQTGASSGELEDLTVFEQMMYRVYDTSGLAENSFDDYHDFEYLLKASNVRKEAIKLKLQANIKSEKMNETNWASEIALLTTDDLGSEGLIQTAKNLESKGALSGGSISMDNSLMDKLAPGEVMKLLTPLAKSKVCGDAFGSTIRSFFTSEEGGGGLGVEGFSEHVARAEGKTEFSSLSAFKEEGIAYDYVAFSSSSYDGGESVTFLADAKGDGSYSLDLSATLAKFDSSSPIPAWTFDTSSLRCDFKITIDSPGTLSYSFNAVSYYIEEDEVGGTLDAIELFLCSLYIDDASGGKTYYTFEGDSSSASTLQEAYDQVDLYGLCEILMESGFYANSYFDKNFVPTSSLEEDGFSASAHALYQLFSVKVEVTGGATAKVKVLDAVDTPALEEAYPAGVPEEARYASIQKLIKNADEPSKDANPFAEGKFLEQSLKGIAASKAVHLANEETFSSSLGDEAKTYLYLTTSNELASHQSISGGENLLNGDYYERFLASREVSYDYTIADGIAEEKVMGAGKSVFADSLIADALNDRVSERLSYVNLSAHSLSGGISLDSPSDPSRARIDFLSGEDQALVKNFSAYGYESSAKNCTFSDMNELIETEKNAVKFMEYCAKGYSLTGASTLEQYKLTAAQKSDLASIAENLDGCTNASAKAYMNLAYASNVYDYLILKGEVALASLKDYFYHGDAGTLAVTDFPDTDGEGYVSGALTPFSYQNVVSTLYAEA